MTMSSDRKNTWRSIAALVVALVALAGIAGLVTACGTSDGGKSTSTKNVAATTGMTSQTVTMTDQAGRKVTIPKTINKVYGMSPVAVDDVYMLAPEKLAGWNYAPAALEKKYVLSQYQNLPNLGGWYGKNNTGNIEEIIKAKPDVVLSVGEITSSNIAQADKVQNQLNIPVVMVNDKLTKTGDTLRYLGKLLGVETRADELPPTLIKW